MVSPRASWLPPIFIMYKNEVILFDGDKFPQARFYAEVHGIYAENLRFYLKFKQTQPSRHNYSRVYFVVADNTFNHIIDSHKREFPTEIHSGVIDYTKMGLQVAKQYLRERAITQPFEDYKQLCKQMAERLVRESAEQQRIEEQRIEDETKAFLDLTNEKPDEYVLKTIRKTRRAKYRNNG